MDPQKADALEEQYFTDRTVLLQLRAVETDLIRDYLAGRLTETERQLFEGRYLKIPELVQRVEEVRDSLPPAVPSLRPPVPMVPPPPRGVLKTFLFAALAAGVVCLVWIVRHPSPTAMVAVGTVRKPAQTNGKSIRLQGGVLMGSDQASRLELGGDAPTIQFRLVLPPGAAGADCSVKLSRRDRDGDLGVVWESPAPIRSIQVGDDWELKVDLPTALAKRGEHVFEVGWPGHRPGRTYAVRLVSPENGR